MNYRESHSYKLGKDLALKHFPEVSHKLHILYLISCHELFTIW